KVTESRRPRGRQRSSFKTMANSPCIHRQTMSPVMRASRSRSSPLRPRRHMPSFDEYDRVRPTDTDPTSTSDDESAGGSTSPRRRPSGSPSELIQQLLRELARVRNTDLNEEERSDAFHLVRAYLAHAQALAWKDVVQGTDLLGPRRVLIALQRVRPFVDRHYPDLEPAGQIAIEIETVMAGLLAAEDTLERIRAERRMKDPDLSALEQ